MMTMSSDKIYVIGLIIGVIVLLGFGINYYVKKLVNDEMASIRKEKMRRKMRSNKKMMRQRRVPRQNNLTDDMDSYIDPADDDDNERDMPERRKRGRKYNNENIMMRDIDENDDE